MEPWEDELLWDDDFSDEDVYKRQGGSSSNRQRQLLRSGLRPG